MHNDLCRKQKVVTMFSIITSVLVPVLYFYYTNYTNYVCFSVCLIVMGQTLSSAAQWTSATDDGGLGKLELTKANEVILNKIIGFVDGFPSKYSAEAKLAFKQPLIWTTELTSSEFSSGYTQK